jgi:1,4-alpha-glucan branching enzyme
MSTGKSRSSPSEIHGRADPGSPAGGSAAETPAKLVHFELMAEPGSKVFLAGTFNDWDPTQIELAESNGVYSASVLVPVGRHEYKFVINGVWTADPRCPEWVPNALGTLNSVLTVS